MMSPHLAPLIVPSLTVLSCVSCSTAPTESARAAADASSSSSVDAGAARDVEVDIDAPTWSPEWSMLFDGTLSSEWQMSTIVNQPGRDDPGHFTVEGGALVSHPGTDLGLLWHTRPTPPSFELEVEWMLSTADGNSGVFVRFPDIRTKGYDNTAWVAVHFGFEVQIDETGAPDGAPEHTTGAIYGEPNPEYSRVVAKGPGEWNKFVIRAEGNVLTVALNGARVTRYENAHADRGLPSTPSVPTFIGLQTHGPSAVAYRNVRIRALD